MEEEEEEVVWGGREGGGRCKSMVLEIIISASLYIMSFIVPCSLFLKLCEHAIPIEPLMTFNGYACNIDGIIITCRWLITGFHGTS